MAATDGRHSCVRGRPSRIGTVSPTVFRAGPFRFFFLSREEPRLHIHVVSPDGEAKYWIEPTIERAKNYRYNDSDLQRIEALIVEHEEVIRDAWQRHFRG